MILKLRTTLGPVFVLSENKCLWSSCGAEIIVFDFRSKTVDAADLFECGLTVEFASARNIGEDESNGGMEWSWIVDGIWSGLPSPL
ncbi:hypothetical protein ACFX11_023996 [Malus domestica]